MQRHIDFLLQTHDCVIVPGLGAILARYVPAYYDEATGIFHAPCREFTFNGGLVHGDGMLVASVARSLGMSYGSAAKIVADEVADMRGMLHSDKSLTLGRVGVLAFDDSGRVLFTPSHTPYATPSLAWMPDFKVQTFESRSVDEPEKEDNLDATKKTGEDGIRSRVWNLFKVAASIAVLVAVAIVASTPVEVEDAQFASVGIEQFGRHDDEKMASELIRRPGAATAPVVLLVAPFDDAEITDNTPLAVTPLVDTDKYCLVVASLNSKAEADRYIKKNSGSDLGILVKDGRYRIYAATGVSIEDVTAKAEALNLSEIYPSSWICRR